MYRCEIIYSDDNITIIKSKRSFFILLLLPLFFLMLFIPFYYSIMFLSNQSIICRIIFYFIVFSFILLFMIYYFYKFLLYITSVEIELKNECIKVKQTILGKTIHNTSYPLLDLYPLKKDISANQCSLKFKKKYLPSITIYSDNIVDVIDTIEKKLNKYKNNTIINNTYITIYKFIYQNCKNIDIKGICEINENESHLTAIPKYMAKDLKKYFSVIFAKKIVLILAKEGIVKMSFFQDHISCIFCGNISDIENDLLSILSIYTNKLYICTKESILEYSINSYHKENIFCASSPINQIAVDYIAKHLSW